MGIERSNVGSLYNAYYLSVFTSKQLLKRFTLSTMKSGNEDDLIPISKLVLQLPFELPVGIINQDQYTWPPKSQTSALILSQIANSKRTPPLPPQTSLPSHSTSSPSSI